MIGSLTTAHELAELTHHGYSTVTKACRRLGIAKTQLGYLLTPAEAERLIAAMRDKPGRPTLPR